MLGIYLGTVFVSQGVYALFAYSMKKRLDRKGYIFTKNDESLIEDLVAIVFFGFILFIPIINIMGALKILFRTEELYDECEKTFLKRGAIKLKISKDADNLFEQILENDALNSLTNEFVESHQVNCEKEIVKKAFQQKFESLTDEEKFAYLMLDARKKTLQKESVDTEELIRERRK